MNTPTLIPSRWPSLPAPRASWRAAPPLPADDSRPTLIALPAASVTHVTSWVGFACVLVFVALVAFSVGWIARGER